MAKTWETLFDQEVTFHLSEYTGNYYSFRKLKQNYQFFAGDVLRLTINGEVTEWTAEQYGYADYADDTNEPPLYLIGNPHLYKSEYEDNGFAFVYANYLGRFIDYDDGEYLTEVSIYGPDAGTYTIKLERLTETTVDPIDPQSLMMGWMVGKKLAGMRGKARTETEEPSGTIVGYSYNGVTLPALPEWDKETYPYAYIGHPGTTSPNTDTYRLAFAKVALSVTVGDGYAYVSALNTIEYDLVDGVWTEASYTLYSANPIWSNTDILSKADSTVYLAASEPVPVYE